MFPDGIVEQYVANTIAKLIYMACDEGGRRSQMMDGILEFHRSDDALRKGEEMIFGLNGQRKKVRTVK